MNLVKIDMLFPLQFVNNCGLYNFIEVPAHFFKQIIVENAYGDILFPDWFVPILAKSPKLQEEFEELANCIFSKTILKRKKVYRVFLNNNHISRLCENKLFSLKVLDDDLNDVRIIAKKVFTRLYNTTLQGTLVEKELGENIHQHYKKFREANKSQACPFCGLENYPDRLKQSRSQYDHFLKISKYVFCSINFKNLIPMCSACNEAPNKHRKDILFEDEECNVRRQSFYPFSKCDGANIKVTNIAPSEIGNGGIWNVIVTYVNVHEQEKIETWKNVFNIEDRYAARVSEESVNWIVEFICQAVLPGQEENIAIWRQSFQEWAEKLHQINEYKVVRNGNLKQAYFEYLFRDALDAEIAGIRSMAQSEMFVVRQVAV